MTIEMLQDSAQRDLARIVVQTFGYKEAAQRLECSASTLHNHFPASTMRVPRARPGAPRSRDRLFVCLLAEVFGFSRAAALLGVSKQYVAQCAPGGSPVPRGRPGRRAHGATTRSVPLPSGLGRRLYRAREKLRTLPDLIVAARMWRDGCTTKEIGEVLGKSPGAVIQIVRRARQLGIPAPPRRADCVAHLTEGSGP